MVTLPLLRVRFLPWDAVLPKLILHGLHKGCNSPTTAPIWVHTTGLILQDRTVPVKIPMGTACSIMGLSWAAENFCSAPGAPPAFLLHWPWWLQCYFSPIFSLLSPSCCCAAAFPSLKLSLLLMGLRSRSSRSFLEPAGAYPYLDRGCFWTLLTGGISCSPTYYQNLSLYTQHYILFLALVGSSHTSEGNSTVLQSTHTTETIETIHRMSTSGFSVLLLHTWHAVTYSRIPVNLNNSLSNSC